jgi:hypothetical protein
MKRPGHDLTWYSIRHRWSSVIDQSSSYSNHIDIHYPKCRPGTIANDITNINKQHLRFSADRKGQQSDSVITVSPAPILQHAPDEHHSSTVSHSCTIDIICSELRTIVSQLAVITDHIHWQEKHDNESQDWKFVAMVIDRLCLILFIIFMSIFTTLVCLAASHFYTFQ